MKGTPVYFAEKEGNLFSCLHDAGNSALSFACLAKKVKEFARLVCFDFRGYGFPNNLTWEGIR